MNSKLNQAIQDAIARSPSTANHHAVIVISGNNKEHVERLQDFASRAIQMFDGTRENARKIADILSMPQQDDQENGEAMQ